MRRTEKDEPTVAMLLDIDHFYGESEGRLGPTLIFLCIGFAPLLLYGYYTLYLLIPLWLFMPIWLFYLLRCGLIILGDEKTRLKNFVKQSNDVYSAMYDMLRIKTIHEDGCIEYINGNISYFVVTYNGTTDDTVKRSIQLKKFQSIMLADHSYDVDSQNITEINTLDRRYSNVKLFADAESARDFIDIIDHNRNIVQRSSLLTRVVYEVKGRRSEWKEMHANIQAALNSTAVKAFKLAYLVSDKEEIEEIMSRDVDGVINLEEMLRKKYCNNQYYGSYVAGYDDSDLEVEEPKETVAEGFHSKYEE